MKYFTELKLSGYKSIQDVTVKLHPGINIFIGPNGSGKSNLLTFISYLKDDRPELDSPYVVEFSWKYNKNDYSKRIKKTIELTENEIKNDDFLNQIIVIKSSVFKNDKIVAEFEGNFKSGSYRFYGEEMDFNLKISIVSFPLYVDYDFLVLPKSVKSEAFEIAKLIDKSPLSTYIANSIWTLKKQGVGAEYRLIAFKQLLNRNLLPLVQSLKLYSPVLDIRLSEIASITSSSDSFQLENAFFQFKLKDGWFDWKDLSDGTKRIFMIVHDVLNADEIVLIEEPELGIHPHQLLKLLDFLKEQSYTKQIIISTHSPEVLDVLSTEQLDNINLVSNKKGKTIVKKLSKSQKEKAKDYIDETGSIGDYWKFSDLEV